MKLTTIAFFPQQILNKHSATLEYDDEQVAQSVAHYDLAEFKSKPLRSFILQQISGEAVGTCTINSTILVPD